MKKVILANLIVLAGLVCCTPEKDFEKLADGIVLKPTQGQATRAVRLRVVSDGIIHVTASAADTFSTARSLIVLPELEGKNDWKLEETDDALVLVTRSLRATVKRATGEVSFADSTGQRVLQEKTGGGKTFTPTTVDKLATYQVQQVFDSPGDEAFYGLGAHQNGQMNYKGQDVELIQQNIVDVVPFLYSSRNYGILWDNYSISRFGDPRPYQGLHGLKLYDKDGKAGGLTASYYVKDKVVKTAVEDRIEYEFLETPQVDNFPKDVAQQGKVVWEGAFSSATPGDHKFLVYASGYFTVWVDGEQLFDKWRQGWNAGTTKFNVRIAGDEKHTIK
ncbi:DUF4968 domain-containing protein, partial [Fulvivirgaceae bacterium PWU37]